jgi:beta-aspartyl-peptidase (threonine type)
MEQSEHVLLAGQGAEKFAKSIGTPFEENQYFYTQERYDQLQDALKEGKAQLDHSTKKGPDEKKFGTVGAVALDSSGNLAAATSTGGMTAKKWGRVGDTPIAGAGIWADNSTCAISCTGHGEFFIRSVVAYDVHCLIDYKGMSLQEAAEEVVMNKLVKTEGEGGLVAVDAQGNIAMPFNSVGMYRACKSSSGREEVKIYKD